MPDPEQIFEFVAHFVFWASIVSLLLPPVEVFDSFPRFQKVYAVVVKLISNYAALNLRGKIAEAYKQINAKE